MTRLTKQRQQAQADLDLCQTKLANSQFVDNAPAAIVTKTQDRATELTQKLAQLETQLERLRTIG